MIELEIIQYLTSEGFNAYGEEPTEPQTEYIVIEKTGSKTNNHITTATVAIQSYADSMYSTMALNGKMKESMENFTTNANISKSKLITDYNFTDKAKKKYRYQAIYEITYYQRGTN